MHNKFIECRIPFGIEMALLIVTYLFVVFIVHVGCRRDVLDHTSCGFVI